MAIRDFVIPLALFQIDGNDLRLHDFLVTAFLIGKRGFALTAAHVQTGGKDNWIAGMFVNEGH